jgi:ATP-dependent exoDNAse (exonuclease V) alpha subunit
MSPSVRPITLSIPMHTASPDPSMAIYHLSVKLVSRAQGRSATAASAYRSCTKVRDERTGEVFDYTKKRGLEHAEIVLPEKAGEGASSWARDRERLWNAAEQAEKRKDARVAREYEVALPSELNRDDRISLVREFSGYLANQYGVVVDYAIHHPHRGGDERNTHAHILVTTRQLTAEGFAAKASIELGDKDRAKIGLDAGADEITRTRAHWAELQNRYLKERGHEATVDHRSLEEQGEIREPTRHKGPAITAIERREKWSMAAERQREEVTERLQRAAELGRLQRESELLQRTIIDLTSTIDAARRERDCAAVVLHSPESQREQARAAWAQQREHAIARPDDLGTGRTSTQSQSPILVLSGGERQPTNEHGR